MMVADIGRGVPMLHLYGETGGRTPMSSLLEVMLLCVRAAMADRAAVPMSSLPGVTAPARAGELPLGGGGHPADRDHATDQLGQSAREF